MKRIESLSTPGGQCERHRFRHAGAAGVALCLCLMSTATTASVTCSVSTPGLAFGSYDVFSAIATTGTGTLSVSCTLQASSPNTKVSYAISLSTGSSNSFVQRQMQSGGNTLGYNLYTDNTYSVVWGDGTGATTTVSGSMRLNGGHPSQTDMQTVYGRIPALQDAAVATNYLDNVTVTVTY